MRTDILILKQDLDRLRPLTPRSVAVLDAWYDVELTYTSNAIEGNTLTRMETAVVLEKGITVSGKSLKDHLDIVGHKDALDYVRVLAGGQEPLREGDIRSIHKLVLGRNSLEAGSYSLHRRAIAGSLVRFPGPAEIPPAMREFTEWLSNAGQSYGDAFEAHYRLVSIHPFSDGNGRTARLLMNLLLIKEGYPPVVVGPEDRVAYLTALEARQLAQDSAGYGRFMEDRLLTSLNAFVSHLRRAEAHPIVDGIGDV